MLHRYLIILLLIGLTEIVAAQSNFFDKLELSTADSLRGQLRPERTCYDVLHYDLTIELLFETQSILGVSVITYRNQFDFTTLQIDLFRNMVIDSIVHQNRLIPFKRIEDAVFAEFDSVQKKDSISALYIYYQGQPLIAKRPPWDGGFTWTKDPQNNDWVVVNCQGIGASLWWPNKDHLSDEPEGVDVKIIVPDTLYAVSNGRLINEVKLKNERKQYHWKVSYPINNYNVTLAVGKYAHFKDVYFSPQGDSLDLSYYVLKDNLLKAKKHFQMVPEMMEVYEHYLGKYPFWKDGYALVETPTLGMEHQSAISYGNQYKRGYLGSRIPSDMNWDYIIVHESAHEYWGNSVSCNDLAEMWLHEGFTTYMEALYVEKRFGYDRSVEYLLEQKRYINNRMPILGKIDVNFNHMGSTDQYYKGAWVLHSLRTAINNDSIWFGLLRSYYDKYALSNVTTNDFVRFVNDYTNDDYSAFFDQYLIYKNPPKLIYALQQKRNKLFIKYKWETDVAQFKMPVNIGCAGNLRRLRPSSDKWQTVVFRKMKAKDFKIDVTGAYFLKKKIQF